MHWSVLIEGIIPIILGLASIAEGIRLITMEKIQLYDVLGPGWYTIGVGFALSILGSAYLISQLKKGLDKAKTVDRELRKKMLCMIGALVVYTLLVDTAGYVLSTVIFFLIIFRVVGYRSWLTIGLMSVGISICFYVIFGYWLKMVLPRGILFPQM